MSNLFAKSTQSNSNKKGVELSTRSAIPATCVAMVTAVVDNKFATSEEDATMPVVRFLFHADTDDGLLSKWTPWLKIMSKEKACNKKSNYSKLFEGNYSKTKNPDGLNKTEVIENVLDTDWMFKQKWSIQGVAGKNDYVNIGTIYYDGEETGDAPVYDLEGYPPFTTTKYFGKPYPVLEMFVRLAGGECHKVEEAEMREWENEINN